MITAEADALRDEGEANRLWHATADLVRMRQPEWYGSIRENTTEWALRKFGASGTMDEYMYT